MFDGDSPGFLRLPVILVGIMGNYGRGLGYMVAVRERTAAMRSRAREMFSRELA
jgi:hypothetical protein